MLRPELEQLDPSVARVGDIEAIGVINPQTLGAGEFAYSWTGLTKRGQRMAIRSVNLNEGHAGEADEDIALSI